MSLEDTTAEKHLTPPTLASMLREHIGKADANELELSQIKTIIKDWLETVNLGGVTQHTLLVIESVRKLLITLVDAP